MSWITETVAGIVEGVLNFTRKRPPPPWRYGHAFMYDNPSTECMWCHTFIPGRVQVTSPQCVGPDHKPTKAELGR